MGTPKELFKGVYDLRSNSGVTCDVDPKGGRFLMIRSIDTPVPSPVRVCDTRLDREVAIEILPANYATNAT